LEGSSVSGFALLTYVAADSDDQFLVMLFFLPN
jgi:hypothetical protein